MKSNFYGTKIIKKANGEIDKQPYIMHTAQLDLILPKGTMYKIDEDSYCQITHVIYDPVTNSICYKTSHKKLSKNEK